ncbi:MAG: hypothetical protein Q7T40_00670 [Methylobacter sp.]|nr:hypothetical protein [Methylobacter sp.]
MSFINNMPPLAWALIGLLVGALMMRLLTGKDKILIRQLSTDLAVAEEKLRQFQNREAEFKQCVGCAEQSEAHLSRLMRFVPQHILRPKCDSRNKTALKALLIEHCDIQKYDCGYR